ncbi:MAG: orotidine-5'-phosphate decarboxylase [Bdellovibrio sp.]|nr:orotidine-5'-phosphate decarboxylase [Bdellovibrio sp.]
MSQLLKNPLILALDVDTKEDAQKILDYVGDLVGGIKLGPRLVYRYGASLVTEFAEIAPVFVDNKYFDIPSTMEAAVRASFQAGATIVTVHALSGLEALTKLNQLEIELNRIRPFKILAVTILTSWEKSSLPENFHSWSIENHVRSLSQLVYRSGLRGIVCSGHELEFVSQKDMFKVIPGIRMSSDESSVSQDQKRVMTPKEAIKAGASALVVGRAILKSNKPRQTILDILESC